MDSRRLLIGIAFCLIASAAVAQKRPIVPPEEASGNVHRVLSEIHWNTNLASAEAQARREGKLVFLVHMKGKIDGMT
jgi:hypothetical protein